MQTFLRKFRRSMIGSGSLQKYLLYAIGEIALIVIGILIALQISNMNEVNKRNELQKKILIEIKSELAITRVELQTDLSNHIYEIKLMDDLTDHILHQKPMKSPLWLNLLRAAEDHQVYPQISAFENLKAVGLDIISNDTLRREITNMYQLGLKRVIDRGDYNPKYDIETYLHPYLKKHIEIDKSLVDERNIPGSEGTIKLYGGKIKDIDEFLRDEDLIQELQIQLLERRNKIQLHHDTVKDLDDLVQFIDRELEKMK